MMRQIYYCMDLSPVEAKAYQLIFLDGMTSEETTARLNDQGFPVGLDEIRRFKKRITKSNQLLARQEYALDSILESWERTKFEFEDLECFVNTELIAKLDDNPEESRIL